MESRDAAHHLPHQSVVVVGFDLACIDQFTLERAEAPPFRDAAPVCEDPAVRHISPGGLEDDQTCNQEKMVQSAQRPRTPIYSLQYLLFYCKLA